MLLSAIAIAVVKHAPVVPRSVRVDAVKALTAPVDSIAVVKHLRVMYVFHQRQLLKSYKVSLGRKPIGAKHFEGDQKTPEGLYYINSKNPHSKGHKSLGISYPNKNDRAYASSKGMPAGGDVMIHGMFNSAGAKMAGLAGIDWTAGCIAVTNKEADELYQYVGMGSAVYIMP